MLDGVVVVKWRSTVCSGLMTTSSAFSPNFNIVHLMTRWSRRIIPAKVRSVRGEVSKSIVQ
jgi:hypothetical protein